MKRHTFAAALALTLVGGLGFSGASAADEQVPLRGSLEGMATLTPIPGGLSVQLAAAGTATQLGHFTLAVPHVVNSATRTATGTYEFEAANGDTLSADFSGISVPTSTPGVLLIVETATITGGTGRFVGATGAFRVERLFNLASGDTSGSFEGTISSPGAGN